MRYESDLTILGVVTIFFAVTVLAFQWAERRRWRFRSQQPISRETPLSRLIGRLREPQNLPFWSYLAVATAVAVYGCLIVAETTSLASDVRLLVIALLAVTVILLAIRRDGSLSIVEKAALYVTTAVLVYLDNVVLAPHRPSGEINWVFVLIAAAGTMLNVRLSSDRRFVMTPLDLIVLFVALVVPSLPGSASTPDWGVAGIAKLVILFYAVEVMISRADLWTVWVRLGAASLLAGLTVRPLLSG
jgi:UDP-GlcNAc:undecaprenyl-phosphate GlcNAc-1-phosphate transferase